MDSLEVGRPTVLDPFEQLRLGWERQSPFVQRWLALHVELAASLEYSEIGGRLQ